MGILEQRNDTGEPEKMPRILEAKSGICQATKDFCIQLESRIIKATYEMDIEDFNLIQTAMMNSFLSDDPAVKAAIERIPKVGEIPTPEEIIASYARQGKE